MIALTLLLAAAPPAASRADSFVAAKQWEELYLAFAAAPAKGYTAAERSQVAAALTKGCVALDASDVLMAYSLGDKAVEFEPTAEALICVGRTGQRADQKSAAQKALETGASTFPKDARFSLELGRLALSENDGAAAVAALTRVPEKSPQAKEAAELLKRARALESAGKSAKSELGAAERDLQRKQEEVAQHKRPGTPAAPTGTPPESGDLELAVGAERVIKIPDVTSIAVQDNAIAEVKTIGNHDLLFSGIAKGQTMVLIRTNSGKAITYAIVVR